MNIEFIYTEDCSTGITQIDSEHKYLFSIMNKIVENLESAGGTENSLYGLEEYVGLLIEYGKTHFAHEEQYMQEHNDLELARQKREHAMFMQKICSLDLQELTNGEKRRMLEETLKYLTKWLYSHIIGSDTLIGRIRHIVDEIKPEEGSGLFTEKYMTGIPQVDDEHRTLFKIIEDAFMLVESGKDNVESIYDDIMGLIDQLEEYAAAHFSHEEEYMEEIRYPHLEEQKRAHGYFIDKMKDKDLGENIENQKEFLEELLDFLFAWLGNHILRMDKMIGSYKSSIGNIS